MRERERERENPILRTRNRGVFGRGAEPPRRPSRRRVWIERSVRLSGGDVRSRPSDFDRTAGNRWATRMGVSVGELIGGPLAFVVGWVCGPPR